MARTSQRDVLADRQRPAQPALFDDSQMPVEAAALESIRQRRYEFKGVRLVEDDEKGMRLVELLALKWGVKKISREMNISPHTVRAARRLLVSQGKLAPYKQRVVEMMEDVIEAGVEKYRDALEEGRVPAAQIPVGVAIMFDKRALAMGEPTSISGRGEAQAEGLKVEDINAYLERLPSCMTDSVSAGNPMKPQQIAANGAHDVNLDVTTTQPEAGQGDLAAAAVQSDGQGRTDAAGAQAAAGGGGGAGRCGAD